MSYEIAVQRARATMAAAPTSVPDFAAVHAALEQAQRRPTQTRRVIAPTGALAAALTMLLDAAISVQWGAPVIVTLAVAVVLLLASSAWIQRPTFSSQLLARGPQRPHHAEDQVRPPNRAREQLRGERRSLNPGRGRE